MFIFGKLSSVDRIGNSAKRWSTVCVAGCDEIGEFYRITVVSVAEVARFVFRIPDFVAASDPIGALLVAFAVFSVKFAVVAYFVVLLYAVTASRTFAVRRADVAVRPFIVAFFGRSRHYCAVQDRLADIRF